MRAPWAVDFRGSSEDVAPVMWASAGLQFHVRQFTEVTPFSTILRPLALSELGACPWGLSALATTLAIKWDHKNSTSHFMNALQPGRPLNSYQVFTDFCRRRFSSGSDTSMPEPRYGTSWAPGLEVSNAIESPTRPKL
jgi:hypothetical protein